MSAQFHISHKTEIALLLNGLQADTPPLWGNMTAQKMVEHLVDALRYTNDALQASCIFTPEEASARKQRAKNNDAPMPRHVKFGDLPETYEFTNLQSAIHQLVIELEKFDKHFETPGLEEIHGAFGPMNHEEWIWWHNKHFTHHFTQFGLIIK